MTLAREACFTHFLTSQGFQSTVADSGEKAFAC